MWTGRDVSVNYCRNFQCLKQYIALSTLSPVCCLSVCLWLASYDIMTMVTCWHGPSPSAGPDLVPWSRSSGAPAHGAVATWNLNWNTVYNVWSHSYRVLQKRVGGSVECGGCAAQCASGWGNLCGEATVVIILSRGAKGRISLGLCHYLMWSQPARPSPDMVLTLQLPVSSGQDL